MGITQPDLEALQRRNVESSQRQEVAHALGRPQLALLPSQLPFGSGRFTVDEMRQGFRKLRAGKE